jgi:hypothetical protein
VLSVKPDGSQKSDIAVIASDLPATFSLARRAGAKPFGLESFDPELTTEGLMAERPVEGNAEPRFSEAGRKQAAEKTSP